LLLFLNQSRVEKKMRTYIFNLSDKSLSKINHEYSRIKIKIV
jgi:hypothetical protein